ncbi:lysylphosphatidylglycerol synthase domain-containing protein [Caenimonas soli]|uniref:lysylphosphatidylglycerol synthase domain-containing protein n=1 Tax=Caenimonas soli TaxID=2735555 RepID=UPI001F1AA560|nr:lysylphosphatidylglycerol synthase domain-containing protein [Caenimonas soli]
MGSRTLPRNAMAGEPSERQARPWWPWTRRLLTLLFFVAVLALLVRFARNVDWDDVFQSVRDTPRPALLAAIGFAMASHLLYSCFDLIGRRYTGHELATRKVMTVNFISYAFNLNLGTLVGGVAFRYRLYSRLGLDYGEITRIVSVSMLTNWIGYLLLGGLLFLLTPLQLPPSWKMGNHGLQWIGAAMVLGAIAYFVACLRAGNRVWTVRGHEIFLPQWRMAGLQLAISCLNWSLMGGAVFMLLQRQVPYTDVLTVLLIGAIAGVLAHVPAGLGVFEFIFVALLSHQVSEGRLIGALLGYRAIYYIVPLMVAAVLYLVMELHARKLSRLNAEGVP